MKTEQMSKNQNDEMKQEIEAIKTLRLELNNGINDGLMKLQK